jgi:hypothetical protein
MFQHDGKRLWELLPEAQVAPKRFLHTLEGTPSKGNEEAGPRFQEEGGEQDERCRAAIKVFVHVEETALQKVEQAMGADLIGGALSGVVGLGLGKIHTLPSGLRRPQGQVNIFIIQEKAGIKALNLFKSRPPDKAKAAGDLIDGAGILMIPFQHKMWREALGEEVIQP